jgi:hypothetical protein
MEIENDLRRKSQRNADVEQAVIAIAVDLEIMRSAETRLRAQLAALASQHGVTLAKHLTEATGARKTPLFLRLCWSEDLRTQCGYELPDKNPASAPVRLTN